MTEFTITHITLLVTHTNGMESAVCYRYIKQMLENNEKNSNNKIPLLMTTPVLSVIMMAYKSSVLQIQN